MVGCSDLVDGGEDKDDVDGQARPIQPLPGPESKLSKMREWTYGRDDA